MVAKNSGCRTLGVLVVVTSLFFLATGNRVMGGNVALQSDEMLILGVTGGILFDNFLAEPPPTGAETTLIFRGDPANLPPVIPLTTLIGLPDTKVVVLTEPAGAVPEPGEVPIMILGTQVVVSDIVMSSPGIPANGVGASITLVSDGGPDLAQLVALLPVGTAFMPETGLLQDLSTALAIPGSPFGPITVLVQSDGVVPEPSSVVLAAFGFVGLAAWCWRRKRTA